MTFSVITDKDLHVLELKSYNTGYWTERGIAGESPRYWHNGRIQYAVYDCDLRKYVRTGTKAQCIAWMKAQDSDSTTSKEA